MNAPNSTPGERDLDALRRAQRAHEPSMEEILASIRSIIADDREPAAARTAPKPDAAPSGPQIVYSKDDLAPARAAEPPPPAEPPTPKVVWSQPQPQAAAPASAPKPEPGAGDRGGGAAAVRPGRRGRFGCVRGPFDQPRAAELRTRRKRGARNSAAAAEDLARRKSPQHGRAAGARPRSSGSRAAAAERLALYEAAPGLAARPRRIPTLTFASALAFKRARPSRFPPTGQRFSRRPRAAPRSSTRRAAVAPRSATAVPVAPR